LNRYRASTGNPTPLEPTAEREFAYPPIDLLAVTFGCDVAEAGFLKVFDFVKRLLKESYRWG
jgi:hypothetical protein